MSCLLRVRASNHSNLIGTDRVRTQGLWARAGSNFFLGPNAAHCRLQRWLVFVICTERHSSVYTDHIPLHRNQPIMISGQSIGTSAFLKSPFEHMKYPYFKRQIAYGTM